MQFLQIIPLMDYFKKLLNVLVRPRDAAAKLKAEKGTSKALNFLLISLVISAIIMLIPDFVHQNDIATSIFMQIQTVVSGVFLAFIPSGLIHVIMKFFGDSKAFHQSFKAVAYSYAVNIPFSICAILIEFVSSLSFMNYLLAAWSIVVTIVFLRKYSDLSRTRFILAMMAIIVIPIIIVLVAIGFLAYYGVLSPQNLVQ